MVWNKSFLGPSYDKITNSLSKQNIMVQYNNKTIKIDRERERERERERGRERLHVQNKIEPRNEKTNILVSDLVRHKPGCTAIEDDQRLVI